MDSRRDLQHHAQILKVHGGWRRVDLSSAAGLAVVAVGDDGVAIADVQRGGLAFDGGDLGLEHGSGRASGGGGENAGIADTHADERGASADCDVLGESRGGGGHGVRDGAEIDQRNRCRRGQSVLERGGFRHGDEFHLNGQLGVGAGEFGKQGARHSDLADLIPQEHQAAGGIDGDAADLDNLLHGGHEFLGFLDTEALRDGDGDGHGRRGIGAALGRVAHDQR